MIAYLVTWKKKPYPLQFLIDFSDEGLAVRASVALTEIGRQDVKVTTVEYEEDPELKARMWERVQARLREMPVFA